MEVYTDTIYTASHYVGYSTISESTLQSIFIRCKIAKPPKWGQHWKPTTDLLSYTRLFLRERTTHWSNLVAHLRDFTIPLNVHFWAADHSLITFHLYTGRKEHMIYLTLWYLYFYWQKSKGRVKGDCDVAFHCYSGTSIIKSGELPVRTE